MVEGQFPSVSLPVTQNAHVHFTRRNGLEEVIGSAGSRWNLELNPVTIWPFPIAGFFGGEPGAAGDWHPSL